MKPPPFRYVRPTDLDAVIETLGRYGDDAKLLAGGQSLLPLMNFRLARPDVLVDLERVPGLDDTVASTDNITFGAMVRQASVAASDEVRARLPMLAAALRHVGHHQIRTRGTIGGSLAHADPAAELPAVALLLGATIEALGPAGPRTIKAEDFFEGPYTTALADDEVLTSVRFPTNVATSAASGASGASGAAWTFDELARRGGDFAVAGLAAMRSGDGVRLVAFGMGWAPLRLTRAEAAFASGPPGEATIEAAATAAHDEVDPMSDLHADAAYRRDAIRTLVARSLRAMAA